MRRTLAFLFTAAPFVAGAIAAFSVRHDVRMLWMALAATVTSRVVVAAMAARAGGGSAAALAAFAAATAAACAVAVLFGARGVFGVVAVAVVLAGCATAGAALGRRAPAA